MEWIDFVLFIFHRVFPFSYVVFIDSQLEEVVVMEFEAIEEDPGKSDGRMGYSRLPSTLIVCVLA